MRTQPTRTWSPGPATTPSHQLLWCVPCHCQCLWHLVQNRKTTERMVSCTSSTSKHPCKTLASRWHWLRTPWRNWGHYQTTTSQTMQETLCLPPQYWHRQPRHGKWSWRGQGHKALKVLPNGTWPRKEALVSPRHRQQSIHYKGSQWLGRRETKASGRQTTKRIW